jgi:hypothetical protein
MSRVRAALVSVGGAAAVALACLLGASPAAATTPPTGPPPVTAELVAAAPGTVPAEVVPTTAAPVTVPPPAGSRGGVDAGSVVKPTHETWTVERIVVTTVLAVIALAAIGYVYGRLRSLPPKHPDLTQRAEDLETLG